MWGSKVEMRDSFRLIEEYFENGDTEMTNAKCTTIVLNQGGENFFKGYIDERERYQRLVNLYADFIHRTVTKTRQLGLTKLADRLETNKQKFKKFLMKNKWTTAEISGD